MDTFGEKIYNNKITETGVPYKKLYSSGYSFPYEHNEFVYKSKLFYRIVKKHLKKYINKYKNKKFTNIVYLTANCSHYILGNDGLDSPIDYMTKIRKQYPEINFCLLVPIVGLREETKISKKIRFDFDNKFYDLEKTSINFDFYAKNKNWECSVYKFNKNESNIAVYGIYSPAFSYLKNTNELMVFDRMVMFMKAARTVIKNLSKEKFEPELVHSELLPFFLGAEFEPKFPSKIKVLQVFNNFAQLESTKQEPFWSVLNLIDKRNMKKIYNDKSLQNSISKLFNLPIKKSKAEMPNCINLIYDNYKIFYNPDSKDFDNKGNIIFRQLNNRIQKMFPNLFAKTGLYYYPFFKTMQDCDVWTVYSKTYYNDIFEQKLASPRIMDEIVRTADKSGYLDPVVNVNQDNQKIYNDFNNENYREERIKNKKTLIKEFSSDSINTNFIDKTIFKNPESVKICGYLDCFYEAPLLFANPSTNIYNDGTDILFSTLLKLFERNRNIQIIISIRNGLKNNYIKSVIEFLQENKIFMGRWIFIDGDVNLPKVFSAVDMLIFPARLCDNYTKHLFGSHYGCVPVVSNAGIFNDTVIDIFDNISEGNGFKTKQNLLYEQENTNIYINCLEKALELYNNRSGWNIIIKNNLKSNTDWDFSKLEHYYQIYQDTLQA